MGQHEQCQDQIDKAYNRSKISTKKEAEKVAIDYRPIPLSNDKFSVAI